MRIPLWRDKKAKGDIVIRIEGWHIGFVFCLLLAGAASYCVTQDDPYWIVFGGLTIFGVWDTNKSYKKMMARRAAEERVKNFYKGGGDE